MEPWTFQRLLLHHVYWCGSREKNLHPWHGLRCNIDHDPYAFLICRTSSSFTCGGNQNWHHSEVVSPWPPYQIWYGQGLSPPHYLPFSPILLRFLHADAGGPACLPLYPMGKFCNLEVSSTFRHCLLVPGKAPAMTTALLGPDPAKSLAQVWVD